MTGLGRSGRGSPGDHGSDLLSISVIQARGAQGAIENFDAACFSDRGSTSTPRVVPCRLFKNDVHTDACDQNRPAAPRGFYLAIARSAVCASPVPHNSSLSCDLTRTRRSAQAAVSVQTHCSRYVDSLAGRTCVMVAKWTKARTQELHRLCPLFADRTQEDGKQTGRGQAHIPASHALTGQLLRLQWLTARPQPP